MAIDLALRPRGPEDVAEAAAAEAAATAPPLAFPEKSVHEEGAQTTTKKKVIDPLHAEDIKTQRIADQQGDEARAVERDAIEKRNHLTEQESGEAAADAQAGLERTQNARAEQDRLVAAAQAEAAQRRAQMEKDAKITTYWEDKGKPAELFSIFMTGLSEMSNVKAGGKYGESPLAKQYADAVAKDEQAKIRKFENSKYFSELAAKDVDAAKKAKADRIAEIKDETVVMGDVLAKRFKSYASKVGTQEALAKADSADATIKATQAKSLAEQEKERDIEVDTAGPKVTKVTNTGKNPDKGPPAATSVDIADREQAKNDAVGSREMARLALNNPQAFEQVKRAMKTFGIDFAEGGMSEKLLETFGRALGRPSGVDDALKDADPDAKRILTLLKERITGKALARKGPITAPDVRESTGEMGLQANTPKEAAHLSFEDANKRDSFRISLEKNKHFRDPYKDEHPGELPSEEEDTRRHDNEKQRKEGRASALANLVYVAGLPALSPKKDLGAAAERAREAGLDEAQIKKFAPGYEKGAPSPARRFLKKLVGDTDAGDE